MRAAIVTGADYGYFPLMHALLRNLAQSRLEASYALVVLDLGLKPEQVRTLELLGADIIRPAWWFEAPTILRTMRNLGYAARPSLPEIVPGFDAYLWLDADISVQDDRFAIRFLDAAKAGALAICAEVDPSYRTELYALKWHVGNAFRAFGLVDGFRLCLARPINCGAFALRADAPHWAAWRQRYQQAVAQGGRANLDQHALLATIGLDGLPVSYLDSTHNWICARSQPLWDEDRQVFCRPAHPFEPIRVLHLAGRQKAGERDIRTLDGEVRSMPLAYAGPAEAMLPPHTAEA